MTTFTLTQAHATADANPSAAALGSAPTEGNLLVLMATERAGTSHASYTFSDIANWTKIIGHDNALANGNARCNFAVWIKKAGASEATSHSVDNGTANAIRTVLMELTPSEAVDAYVVPSGGSASTGTGTDTSFTPPLATGNTSNLAAADYLILCAAGFRMGGEFDIASPTWDNTPDVEDSVDGSTNGRSIAYGFKDDATGGVYGANCDWDQVTFDTEGIASIMAIEAQTGGGGGGGSDVPKPLSSIRRMHF